MGLVTGRSSGGGRASAVGVAQGEAEGIAAGRRDDDQTLALMG